MPETTIDTEPQESRGPRRRRTLAVVGLVVFIVAIPLIIGRTLYTVQGVSRNAYMTELILPALSLLASLGGVLVLRQVFGKQALGIVWFRWNRGEVVGSALSVLAILIVHALTSCLFRRFGWATGSNHVFYAEGLPVGFFVAVAIYMAFATPFTEELFWRGSVQSMLSPAVGAVGAWIVQAALFAGIHLRSLGDSVPLLAFGLMAGLWRWRRRTLLPIILAHVAINSLWCAVRWPGWLEMRQVKITHDYNADLIELSRPSPYDPNDDARYDYERAENAFEILPGEFDGIINEGPTEWTLEQRSAIRQWIAANAQALEHLARGAVKPYYCPNYQMENAHLPNLAAARNLAFALNARIRLRAWEGREEDMVQDMVALYRFGAHFGGKKVLLDQLVGAAIRGMTSTTARKLLAHHSLSTHTLDTLRNEFQAFRDADDDVIDFSLERLFCLSEIQKLFTDDGHGHGHVVEAALDASPGMTAQLKEAFLQLERYETTQSVEAFFRHIEIARRISPWERREDPNGVVLAMRDLMRRNALLDTLGPAYTTAIDIAWMGKTELDAVLAVFAAHRYEVEHGRLPGSLNELVAAGYLKGVPRDGFGPGPLVYRRTGDGFLLYSYGRDFDDDNGTPSNWGKGEQGGDQVFWPVEDYR